MTGAFARAGLVTTRWRQPANVAGERYWQLLGRMNTARTLDSWYADVINTGGSRGGRLVKSALFLREFATGNPGVHWTSPGRRTSARRRLTHRPAPLVWPTPRSVELALVGAS